jgi:hypothetical protein
MGAVGAARGGWVVGFVSARSGGDVGRLGWACTALDPAEGMGFGFERVRLPYMTGMVCWIRHPAGGMRLDG